MNPRLVRAARRVDFVWRFFSILGERTGCRTDVKSILIIDLHLLGDMVMLLPFLEAIRTKYPSARISLLAGPWSEFALRGTSWADEVIPYTAGWVKPQGFFAYIYGFLGAARRLRKYKWDIGIDIRGDIRQILLLRLAGCKRRLGFDFTGGRALLTDVVPDDGMLRHILDHHQRIAALLGAWNGQPFTPTLKLSGFERSSAAKIAPFIGFHFGASLPLRRLATVDAASLIESFIDSAEPLVLFSSPDLETHTEAVLGLLSEAVKMRLEVWRGDLRSFVVKTSRARRMFVMDSGPAHVAAALGCETTVFFGPNMPEYTAPRGSHVVIVQDMSVHCRPCDQRHCINPVHQACMKGLVAKWRQAEGRDSVGAP